MAEKKVISDIGALVERLVADHGRLAGLCTELSQERDLLKKENRGYRERIKELEKELAITQLGEGLGGVSRDQTKAIARVNRLIREVDKCIALMNDHGATSH